MASVKTVYFAASAWEPTVPPNGTSLQERINAFLATQPLSKIMDVQSMPGDLATPGSHERFLGLVIYQE